MSSSETEDMKSSVESVVIDSDDETSVRDEPSSLPFVECLSKAASLKEAGNAAFKDKDLSLAEKCYQDGIDLLFPHKDIGGPSDDVTEEQFSTMISTLVSVQGNLSLLHFKQESWTEVVKSSGEVLKYDSRNVKALYRKGIAQHKLSCLEESKESLLKALEYDPDNIPTKKALTAVTKDIKTKKQKEKSALAGAFSSGSMYNDKEEERKLKQRLAREAEEKLQDDYVKDKLKRREEGKEEQSFEDFKAEKKKAEEERRKEEEAKKVKTVSPAVKKERDTSADSEDEYDEEEQKILRETKKKGYCYFRNKLDEETSALIGDITPKATQDTGPMVQSSIQSSKVEASSWNHAGTWEERDVTEITKSRLKDTCLASKVSLASGLDDVSLTESLANLQTENSSDPAALTKSLEKMNAMMSKVDASITEVKSIDGEAQIVMVGQGKKRQIYDFNMSLKFEVNVYDLSGDESKKKRFKGTFDVMDVTPGASYEHKTNFSKSGVNEKVDAAVNRLREGTLARIHSFFENDYLNL